MEEKICGKCGDKKSIKQFYFKKGHKESSLCKACLYEIQKKRWKDRKVKAVEIMGGCCSKCGYNKNYSALDFHHLDPKEKEFDWRKLRQMQWDKIIEELKKCILVCSNCHSEIHNPSLDCLIYNCENLKDNFRLNNVKLLVKTGQCPKCEKDVFGTKFCSVKCSSSSCRKVTRPSKEELEELIKNNPWVAIGKKYGVSDNAVRKWARSYGLIEKKS